LIDHQVRHSIEVAVETGASRSAPGVASSFLALTVFTVPTIIAARSPASQTAKRALYLPLCRQGSSE
jgi:hypothetical protein